MSLTAEDKQKIYRALSRALSHTSENLINCQEHVSVLLNDAHETETSDGLLIMTDVLQALNLALAWTDSAADRVGVLKKLAEPVVVTLGDMVEGPVVKPPAFPVPVVPKSSESKEWTGIYLRCTGCGILQPAIDGVWAGDTCPVCGDATLKEDIPF